MLNVFNNTNTLFICLYFRVSLRKDFPGQNGQDVSGFSLHQYLANRRNVVPCFVSPIGYLFRHVDRLFLNSYATFEILHILSTKAM